MKIWCNDYTYMLKSQTFIAKRLHWYNPEVIIRTRTRHLKQIYGTHLFDILQNTKDKDKNKQINQTNHIKHGCSESTSEPITEHVRFIKNVLKYDHELHKQSYSTFSLTNHISIAWSKSHNRYITRLKYSTFNIDGKEKGFKIVLTVSMMHYINIIVNLINI